MINSNIAKTILDGFCINIMESNAIEFAKDHTYLGLLTVMPQNNEQPYEDGTYFKEPNDPEYQRIRLNDKNPLEQIDYVLAADAGEPIEVCPGVFATPAVVTNPTYIMFPESSVAWGNVVGFGIFDEASGTNLPFIWGPITAADGTSSVEVGSEEIPIIRAGSFKISLY